MFKFNTADFIAATTLTKPIDDSMFVWENIRFFDNDGFQLSKLEQEFYRANGIELNYINGVWGAQREWVESTDTQFVIDHSMTIARCNYGGEALEQIRSHFNKFPYLKKYTKIRPKWGIDFALEYFHEDTFLEVLHLELDFNDMSTANIIKKFYEHKIEQTDWQTFTNQLIAETDQWTMLEGMKRNDWKAKKWGMASAENILKVV